LRSKLLPRTFLVTPNRAEAASLTDQPDPARAAAALVGLGAKSALVKQSGTAHDILFDGRATHEFPVQPQGGTHRGTGCRLASRITASLAQGTGLVESVRHAHAALQQELAYD